MMKKAFLVFSFAWLLLFGAINLVTAQEQPKPKKDTVNIDTDAKPTFYYATEDEKGKAKGSTATIPIIAGVVILAAAAGFFLMKKKK